MNAKKKKKESKFRLDSGHHGYPSYVIIETSGEIKDFTIEHQFEFLQRRNEKKKIKKFKNTKNKTKKDKALKKCFVST